MKNETCRKFLSPNLRDDREGCPVSAPVAPCYGTSFVTKKSKWILSEQLEERDEIVVQGSGG